MKELDAMRIFLQVAEQSSFSAAAEVLGIPRSTVSAAVQQLEAELGSRLLQRTTRRVQITADGELFMQRAQAVLDDIDELKNMFGRQGRGLQGVVRVDMPVPLARDLILPALAEFIRDYPEIRIELSSTDRRVDPLAEGFDLVVRVGKLTDSSLVARRLGEHRMTNCASPDYVQHYGRPETLDDLAGHYLVGYSQTLGRNSHLFDYQNSDGVEQSLAMNTWVTVNNAEAYSAACLAGLGIVQSPWLGLKSYIERGDLIELLPQYRCAPMPVSVLYPERHFQPLRVRVFMDWLAEKIRAQLLLD